MSAPDPYGRDRRPGVHGLRVGAVPGVTVTKWSRIWRERFPRLTLEVLDVAESDQRAALDDNRVDMCFVRLPVDADGVHAIPLYAEVPVVVVPRDHPVSLYDEVTLAELGEEEVLDAADPGLAVDLVAGGAGVLLVPQSVARSYSRRDLVHRPVRDAAPTQVALAWLADNPHELIEEFIGIVRGRTPNSTRTSRPENPRADPAPPRSRGAARRRPGPRGSR